jgi:hypothetical protein
MHLRFHSIQEGGISTSLQVDWICKGVVNHPSAGCSESAGQSAGSSPGDGPAARGARPGSGSSESDGPSQNPPEGLSRAGPGGGGTQAQPAIKLRASESALDPELPAGGGCEPGPALVVTRMRRDRVRVRGRSQACV